MAIDFEPIEESPKSKIEFEAIEEPKKKSRFGFPQSQFGEKTFHKTPGALKEAAQALPRALARSFAPVATGASELGSLLGISPLPRELIPEGEAIAERVPLIGSNEQNREKLNQLSKDISMGIDVGGLGLSGARIAPHAPEIAKGAANALANLGKYAFDKATSIPGIKQLTGKNVRQAESSFEEKGKNFLNDLFKNESPQKDLTSGVDKFLKEKYGTENYHQLIGEENKLLGQRIKNNFENKLEESKALYDKSLLEKGNELLPPAKENVYWRSLEDAPKGLQTTAREYVKNPTANNAHDLQSRIGDRIRSLRSMKHSSEKSAVEMKDLQEVQSNLKDQLAKFLGDDYKKATEFYAKEIVPYRESPVTRNLMKGKVSPNLNNFLTKTELEGAYKPTVNTIIRHMNDTDKEAVVLNAFKGTPSKPVVSMFGEINPEQMTKVLGGLETKGLRPYLTPKIRGEFNELNKLAKNSSLEKKLTEGVLNNEGAFDANKLLENMKKIDLSNYSQEKADKVRSSLKDLQKSFEKIEKQEKITKATRHGAGYAGAAAGGYYGANKFYHGGH